MFVNQLLRHDEFITAQVIKTEQKPTTQLLIERVVTIGPSRKLLGTRS